MNDRSEPVSTHTTQITGIGYSQRSVTTNNLKGLIITDGGCAVPGDAVGLSLREPTL